MISGRMTRLCIPTTNQPAAASGRQELEAEAWMTDGVNELCPKLPSQPKIGHSEFKRAAFLYTCAFLFTQSAKIHQLALKSVTADMDQSSYCDC